MQVTCPNCGARYAVDPLAIGPAGRIVQCARCSHRWYQVMTVAQPKVAIDTAPVPDVVIRPITPGAGLPAVIEPKPSNHWVMIAAGIGAAIVLLAVTGIFVFRDEIADQIPVELLNLFGLKA